MQDSPSQYDDPLARDWSQDVPAHFTVVDGQVMLERDARLEPAEPNQIVMAGDRLRTTTGRTEILFPDGSTLAVDQDSEVDFLSDSLIRLLDGRVRLTIKKATKDLDYRIDTAPGHVEVRSAGDYSVALGKDKRGKAEIDVMVYRGTADLVNDNGTTAVRAGKHAVTSADTEPSLPYSFNSASQDEFDEWIENLREAHVVNTATSQSAQNLPEEAQYYASTMDTYGSWGYQEPYGAVWYPSVAVGWYPYYQGRWAYTPHYRWTWVGIDHWAWPTYHYGSWGVSNAGWYWIPGYAYAPAWVSWGYAPGYVGWCPIGYGGKPVGGWGWNAPGHHGGPWTVVPSGSMGHNMWASQNAMRPDQMPMNSRAQFTERRAGPMPTGSAITRADVPSIGAPTVPRSATGARPGSRIDVSTSPRGGNQAVAPLSGFPATNSRAVMPDAVPRATSSYGRDSGAAIRAVPRGVQDDQNGQGGLPAVRSQFPDANRSVPRAEITNNDARVGSRGADGFPSSAATRAVPRGLDSQSDTPIVRRAEPSSSGTRGAASDGFRSAPTVQMPPDGLDRGRSAPRPSAPPSSGASYQPVMPAAERRAPVVAAPSSSMPAPPPSSSAHGRSVAPAPAPAQSAPPPSAAPSRGGGSSGGAATSGGAQGGATARGRGRNGG